MFRITFLGTSASVPTLERSLPSIAIKYESQLLLWDCGEGTQRQLMKYKVGYGSINAIFITHPHLDHYLGLFGLLETLKLSSPSPKPVQLFLPKAIEVRDYDFTKVSAVKKGKLFSANGFTIHAFPVKHTKGAYGFVFQENAKIKFNEKKAHGLGLEGKQFSQIQEKGIVKIKNKTIKLVDVSWVQPGRKIVYAGDCAPSSNIIEEAKDADLLIYESTFDSSLATEAKERFHSTAEDAANIAKQANVKKLILTHISPRYSDVDLLLSQARKIFPKTDVAIDGMTIDIKQSKKEK